MEAFESLVRVGLETEGFAVSTNMKFPVARRTKKKAYEETQTHGYEVDLVGARKDLLILASAKSFFGSRGVTKTCFAGLDDAYPADQKGYMMFNEPEIRNGIIAAAAQRFGYRVDEIQLRLYVGRFAPNHEVAIRAHLSALVVGRGAVQVFGAKDIAGALIRAASSKTYVDNPALVTVKVLLELGLLKSDAR